MPPAYGERVNAPTARFWFAQISRRPPLSQRDAWVGRVAVVSAQAPNTIAYVGQCGSVRADARPCPCSSDGGVRGLLAETLAFSRKARVRRLQGTERSRRLRLSPWRSSRFDSSPKCAGSHRSAQSRCGRDAPHDGHGASAFFPCSNADNVTLARLGPMHIAFERDNCRVTRDIDYAGDVEHAIWAAPRTRPFGSNGTARDLETMAGQTGSCSRDGGEHRPRYHRNRDPAQRDTRLAAEFACARF